MYFFDRPQDVIVFIVGGTTYEEARVVSLQNATNSGVRFILGGSAILNSKRYVHLTRNVIFLTRWTATSFHVKDCPSHLLLLYMYTGSWGTLKKRRESFEQARTWYETLFNTREGCKLPVCKISPWFIDRWFFLIWTLMMMAFARLILAHLENFEFIEKMSLLS